MLELNIKTDNLLASMKQIRVVLMKAMEDGLITHFHFFLDEPWSDICLRIETDVVAEVEARFDGFGEWQDFDRFNEEQEWYPFWDDFKHLFQAVSQWSLDFVAKKERPKLCTAAKLVHCMLNTLGYSRFDEMEAYGEWCGRAGYIHHVEESGELISLAKVKKRKKGYAPKGLPPSKRRGILVL